MLAEVFDGSVGPSAAVAHILEVHLHLEVFGVSLILSDRVGVHLLSLEGNNANKGDKRR